MRAMASFLSWESLFAVFIVYLVGIAFYRLTLHPLAQFPGPKLGAVTRAYEAYYDFILDGKYTFKIKELHMKYGKLSPQPWHIIHLQQYG